MGLKVLPLAALFCQGQLSDRDRYPKGEDNLRLAEVSSVASGLLLNEPKASVCLDTNNNHE